MYALELSERQADRLACGPHGIGEQLVRERQVEADALRPHTPELPS